MDVVVDEQAGQRFDQSVRHPVEALGKGGQHQQLNASRQTSATSAGSASP